MSVPSTTTQDEPAGPAQLPGKPVEKPLLTRFADDADVDDSWRIVTARKPNEKKQVLFVGILTTTTNEASLNEFIKLRASKAGENVVVHNTKIFPLLHLERPHCLPG